MCPAALHRHCRRPSSALQRAFPFGLPAGPPRKAISENWNQPMLDLSKIVRLARQPPSGRRPRQIVLCEWESLGQAGPRRGSFLVECTCMVEARQAAKRFLRDGLLHSSEFTFKIRPLNLVERIRLKFAPPATIFLLNKPGQSPEQFPREDPRVSTLQTGSG